jgi:uncharacterized protein (TIGR02588 family)
MAGKTEQSRKRNGHGERLEWVVATISSVIVIALVGFILYEAITRTGREPDFRFTIEKGVEMADGYAVEIEIHNDGHVTVSDVQIEGIATPEGGESETSTVTLDYLPAESSTKVGLGFSGAMDPEQVRLRVIGYTYP